MIPRFGHFTFSAAEFDLQGTTNPQVRDRQTREPVFMVNKDFVGSFTLKSGIVTTSSSGIATVLPLALKGASGVIPQVKVNYVEVGMLCKKSKEASRDACEQIFKYMSDQIRKGA